MSWVAITIADVLARLTTDEADGLQLVGETAQTDKLTPIIAQVTGYVRSMVASCSRNTMGTAGLIPEDCLYHAVSLIRAALVTAQPTLEGVTDPRGEETKAAHLYLTKVAKCEVAIADPDGTYPWEAAESVGAYGGDCSLDF